MADQKPQETSADSIEKKNFWNKAEQISRVYHNIIDGSFKLVVIIGIVAFLMLGAGIYSKTTSGIDSAKNWGCEYLNPFCDTEREATAKAAKARDKAARHAAEQAESEAKKEQVNVERHNMKEDADTPQTESGNTNENAEEPGMLTRGWRVVKGWLPGAEEP